MFFSVQLNGTLQRLHERYKAELSNELDTFLSCCIIDIKCLFDLRLRNLAVRTPGLRGSSNISLSVSFSAALAGMPLFLLLRCSLFNSFADLVLLPFFVFPHFGLLGVAQVSAYGSSYYE